jgi:hypothetical protein
LGRRLFHPERGISAVILIHLIVGTMRAVTIISIAIDQHLQRNRRPAGSAPGSSRTVRQDRLQ